MKSKHTRIPSGVLLVLGLAVVFAGASWANPALAENEIQRIGPEQARQQVQSGKALLVCSYGDNRCESRLLQGALLRSEFEARLSMLPKTQPIIFYCG